MKSIIIATHGNFAAGILSTLKMFFNDLQQVEAICLLEGEDPDEYSERIMTAIRNDDQGDGVIVFVDIAFATPCNSIVRHFKELDLNKIDVIAGLNLPLLLQAMTSRQSEEFSIDEVVAAGTEGIIDIKKKWLSNR